MGQIAQAAQLACTDIYEPVSATFVKVYRVGSTVCGTKLIGDVLWIALQGTDTKQGWEEDFHAMPAYHPQLGNLHSGFDSNLPALVIQLTRDIDTITPVTPDLQIVITGHSKGAGEGAILGARLKLNRLNVTRLVLFACPNSGFQRLADWIAENIPGSISFRNAPAGLSECGDPVPLVPLFPFVPPVPHTGIDNAPTGFERVLSVEWHQSALYLDGAIAWESAQARH